MSGVRARSRRVRTPQVVETEPHMSLQRPSSSWSQDIAHVLDRCFGSVFSEQAIEVETIRNFTPASDPESYQSKFADRLKNALHQFDTQNNLLDSANKRNSDLHSAFLELFSAEQLDSPAPSLNLPPKGAPDKSLLDLSLFDQTSLISPDSYYPHVFTRYSPPTRDPGVRPNYELTTQNWTEKGQAVPLIRDTTVIRQQPHSNTCRTLKSQFKNRPKIRPDTHTRLITPPKQQKTENFISNVNSDNYFISEPNELLFYKYEPSQIYTGNIILRNVSRYLREFRIFPPKTKYFSFTEQEHELNIAPGMTSLINVIFKPDSFGDYSDQIKVVSEDKKSFFIPLLASRPCPVLSLPYSLDCGHSIVNIERKISFNCCNSGGSSHFTFSNENIWKDPLLWSENFTDYLSLNKFRISPVYFECQTGKSLDINITFLADIEGEFVEEIFLHCSNKSTILFELCGESHFPQVEIQSLNQTENQLELMPSTMDEENGIKVSSQMLTCPSVTFAHSSQLEVTIKNIKPIPLQVKWVFMSSMNKIGKKTSTIFTPLIDNSIFSIYPETLTINPSENHHFIITFTPSRIDTYYVSIQLLLLSNSSPVIATLYLEAECREVSVVPSPPILVTSGAHFIGTIVKQSIQLMNHGCSPVRIEWLTESIEDCIEISPSSCEMAPEQNMYFSVHISRPISGLFEHDLICKIEDTNILVVPLKCTFRGANITIDQLDLNIGLVSIDTTINRTFTLTNNDNTTAFVDLQTRDLNLHPNTTIKIIPNRIEMPAFSISNISLLISTIDTGELDCIIHCIECIGGSTALLPITGSIQRPTLVVTESPLISLGDIFVNVPVVIMVTLRNVSKLPAEFEWDTLIQNSEFGNEFRLRFFPQTGIIKGTDSCEVEIEIVCLQILGSVKDILIICNVENADEPVLLNISCEVNGMSVEFSHNQQPLIPEPNSVSLDFGTVPIGTKNELSFVVSNNTGIASPIKLWVDKFPADIAAGETARTVRRPGQEFDVYLGEDTLRKRIEFDEKSVWRAYLSTGHGACFLVQSEREILSPHSSNAIILTAFSNMWGQYTDTLHCQIEGIDSIFSFQFKINVIGCPLHLHSMPGVQQPIIRFGTHPFEKAHVSRKIRINNTSPCDVRVDWRILTHINRGDQNVVDFEMTYGNPFPSHLHVHTYSDQNVLKSDLIRVLLRPHDSIQTMNTFMISPEQCTIAGYSNVICEFTFFPTTQNLTEYGEYISGYALGYLSLDSPPEYPANVYRPQGKSVNPLRVDFNGGIMHPKIEIAPVNSELDEEVLGFAFPASKLMKIHSIGQFQSIKSSYQTYQQITIQNPTKQKLTFHIILPSELKISDYNQLASNDGLFSLKPNQIVTLKIGFTLQAKYVTSPLGTTQTDWSIQTNTDEHKYLTYKQNIQIEFPSKISQYLPIEARIELPLLKLSTDVINFGETQIGDTFSQQICVYNYARKCYSKWSINIQPDNNILNIDFNEGLLPGFDGGFDFSSKILLVSFSPLEEIGYEFEVTLTGEFLEKPLSLTVYGSGSII